MGQPTGSLLGLEPHSWPLQTSLGSPGALGGVIGGGVCDQNSLGEGEGEGGVLGT